MCKYVNRPLDRQNLRYLFYLRDPERVATDMDKIIERANTGGVYVTFVETIVPIQHLHAGNRVRHRCLNPLFLLEKGRWRNLFIDLRLPLMVWFDVCLGPSA